MDFFTKWQTFTLNICACLVFDDVDVEVGSRPVLVSLTSEMLGQGNHVKAVCTHVTAATALSVVHKLHIILRKISQLPS